MTLTDETRAKIRETYEANGFTAWQLPAICKIAERLVAEAVAAAVADRDHWSRLTGEAIDRRIAETKRAEAAKAEVARLRRLEMFDAEAAGEDFAALSEELTETHKDRDELRAENRRLAQVSNEQAAASCDSAFYREEMLRLEAEVAQLRAFAEKVPHLFQGPNRVMAWISGCISKADRAECNSLGGRCAAPEGK